LAPIVRLNVTTEGRFISGRVIPVWQPWPGGVKYDQGGRVIRKIRELMVQDFPESVISLTEKGEIIYK